MPIFDFQRLIITKDIDR